MTIMGKSKIVERMHLKGPLDKLRAKAQFMEADGWRVTRMLAFSERFASATVERVLEEGEYDPV